MWPHESTLLSALLWWPRFWSALSTELAMRPPCLIASASAQQNKPRWRTPLLSLHVSTLRLTPTPPASDKPAKRYLQPV